MFEAIRAVFFPAQLMPGITVYTAADATAFWQTVGPLMDEVFPPFHEIGAYEKSTTPQAQGQAIAKIFDAVHHERFVIVNDSDKPIGWSYGDMRDAETFFMTNTGLLSAYRQRGIYTLFTRRLLAYLDALGYERVISNHQTNNRAVIIAKLKLGFNITAVNLDERWGAQVELTYLFNDERRRGYERAFALEPRDTPVSHH